MMKSMDIVACTDRWFVMPTGVMILSVCINNPDVDIIFHVVVNSDVTDQDKLELENIVSVYSGKSIRFYSFKENFLSETFPSGENKYNITETTYFRLYIGELLPKTIDKVLYLDGDIIVRHSLLPLWSESLEGCPLAAVCDGYEGEIEFYNRLKYPPYLGYFNAGVLLINLKYWRENQVIKLFKDYMDGNFERIKFHDQDVLNAVFSEKKRRLPILFNLQDKFLYKEPKYDYWKYEEEVLEARKDPVVVHFTGCKPWEKFQIYPHPYRSLFYKYQDLTIWKGVIYDRRPKTNWKSKIFNVIYSILIRLKINKHSNPAMSSVFLDFSPVE